MCGIAGEVCCDQSPVDAQAVLAMRGTVHARSPDSAG